MGNHKMLPRELRPPFDAMDKKVARLVEKLCPCSKCVNIKDKVFSYSFLDDLNVSLRGFILASQLRSVSLISVRSKSMM